MGILSGLGKGMSRAASRTASKVGKDPARRTAASSRLKRIKRNKMKRGVKEFGRDVLEGAMQSQGLNVDKIRGNRRSGTGRLLGYLGGEGFDYSDPALDSPPCQQPSGRSWKS